MNDTGPARKLPVVLLTACCLLPAIQTYVSIQVQWQMFISYPAMKAFMVAVTLAVWLWSRRPRAEVLSRIGMKRTNGVSGLLVGAIMAGCVLGVYYTVGYRLIDPVDVSDKLVQMKVQDYYWIMAVVVSIPNALFEEYYWRGFLQAEMGDRLQDPRKLILVLGALFGLHHICALMFLPDWWVIAIGALVTMIAGGVWTWMRTIGKSLTDVFVAHLIADFAVMWCGWDLLCRGLAAS
jgi:membrane protease YdiL (CAAX protease family)